MSLVYVKGNLSIKQKSSQNTGCIVKEKKCMKLEVVLDFSLTFH